MSSQASSFCTRRLERLLLSETNPARQVLLAQLLDEQRTRIAPQPSTRNNATGDARAAAA